jgi:CheY-like chemotaxis protein
VYAARPSGVVLVITDMMMAGDDGSALIAALRHISADVPLIATSGNSSDDWIPRARAAGAQHTWPNPTAPLLLRMVAGILANRGSSEI